MDMLDRAGKLKRLAILSGRLERMIGNGSFYALPFWRRLSLVRRVKKLYSSLLGPVSPAATRAVMAGAAALALAACPAPGGQKADNPSFAGKLANQFGFSPIVTDPVGPVAPAFADIDHDGDADLFAGAGGEGVGVVAYFKNNGSKNSPSFAPADDYAGLPNASDQEPYQTNYGPVPVFAPLTGGPDWDALIGHSEGGADPILQFFQNIDGTFALPDDPFELPTFANKALTSTVVDLNGDGKLDAIVSDTNSDNTNTVSYYQNVGSSSAPSFSLQPSLDLDPPGDFAYPTFVDIDADGDYDAFVGNEDGDIYYFENTGTSAVPQFAAPVQNPFGLSAVPIGPAMPAFVDIDNDGDFDLFVGDANGDLWFFENKNL